MKDENIVAENCLVEDRGTLVDAVAFIFGSDRRAVSKKSTIDLVRQLEKAHLGCDDILDDLIEDDFSVVDLPNDYGELLMIHYGSCLRFTASYNPAKVAKTNKQKGSTKQNSTVSFFLDLLQNNPTQKDFVNQTAEAGVKKTYSRTWLNRAKKSDKQNPLLSRGLKITEGVDSRLYFSAVV